MNENGKDDIWVLLPSEIHGTGVFARKYLVPGQKIGTGIIFTLGLIPSVTFFGSKINHSYTPNAVLRYNGAAQTHDVLAAYPLPPGAEITIDYRDTPFYIAGPEPHYQ